MAHCCIIPFCNKQVFLLRASTFHQNLFQHKGATIIRKFMFEEKNRKIEVIWFFQFNTNSHFDAFQFDLIWQQKIFSLVPKNNTNTNTNTSIFKDRVSSYKEYPFHISMKEKSKCDFHTTEGFFLWIPASDPRSAHATWI